MRCLAKIWIEWLFSTGRRNRTSVLSSTGVKRSAARFPPPRPHPSSPHHSPAAGTSHYCQPPLNCTKWHEIHFTQICFEGNHMSSNQQKGFLSKFNFVSFEFAWNWCKLRRVYRCLWPFRLQMVKYCVVWQLASVPRQLCGYAILQWRVSEQPLAAQHHSFKPRQNGERRWQRRR